MPPSARLEDYLADLLLDVIFFPASASEKVFEPHDGLAFVEPVVPASDRSCHLRL